MLISRYFQTFWPISLNYFQSFNKNSVYGEKKSVVCTHQKSMIINHMHHWRIHTICSYFSNPCKRIHFVQQLLLVVRITLCFYVGWTGGTQKTQLEKNKHGFVSRDRWLKPQVHAPTIFGYFEKSHLEISSQKLISRSVTKRATDER